MPARGGSFQGFPSGPESGELPLSAPCEWTKESDGRCFTRPYALSPVRHRATDRKVGDVASPARFQSLDLCDCGASPLSCVFVSPVNVR